MKNENRNRICPVEIAGGLDNSIRKLLQNPQKILNQYITPEMTVLDLGCGPGYFSVGIANMLNDTGKVIAADLQEGMLKKVEQKIKGTDLEQKIVLHKCMAEKIDLSERVDFVLAFYMIHEVPDHERLFNELKSILKPGGQILIVEPKLHVSKVSFDAMIERLKVAGFEIDEGPKVFFSRTVVLENMKGQK
jgi:ubiquinone/menaquinone biosynthesis C-methylase UbiE